MGKRRRREQKWRAARRKVECRCQETEVALSRMAQGREERISLTKICLLPNVRETFGWRVGHDQIAVRGKAGGAIGNLEETGGLLSHEHGGHDHRRGEEGRS